MLYKPVSVVHKHQHSVQCYSKVCKRNHIGHCCHHVSSAGSICTVSIVTLCLPESDMNVINGAFAADEPLKVLLDLKATTQQHQQ